MAKIDNRERIGPLLNFDNEGDFYIIELIKRRKDNPYMTSNMKIIRTEFLYSMEDFDYLVTQLANHCFFENARMYIRLNKRNTKKVALATLKKVTDYIISEDWKAVKKAYYSAAGETNCDSNKKWIVDLDFTNESKPRINQIISTLSYTITEAEPGAFEYNGTNLFFTRTGTTRENIG